MRFPARLLTPLLLLAACVGSKLGKHDCACGARAVAPASSATPVAADTGAPASAAPAPVPGPPGQDWNRVTSHSGTYEVCWRPSTGSIPRNQDFELEVWVLRDGAPVKDALLAVSGWMPEHGHGMLRRPRTTVRPDGSFVVDGMLLHMRGHWELRFEVLEGTLAETAQTEVDL